MVNVLRPGITVPSKRQPEQQITRVPAKLTFPGGWARPTAALAPRGWFTPITPEPTSVPPFQRASPTSLSRRAVQLPTVISLFPALLPLPNPGAQREAAARGVVPLLCLLRTRTLTAALLGLLLEK